MVRERFIMNSKKQECEFYGGNNMLEKAVRLLTTAGFLMMVAGCIFGFTRQWNYAALVWIGALCCCIAALNFKNQKNKDTSNKKEEEDGK